MKSTMETLLTTLHGLMLLPHTLEDVEPANDTEAQLVELLRDHLEDGPLLSGEIAGQLYVIQALRQTFTGAQVDPAPQAPQPNRELSQDEPRKKEEAPEERQAEEPVEESAGRILVTQAELDAAGITWAQHRFLEQARPILEEHGPMKHQELYTHLGCSHGRVINNTRALAQAGLMVRKETGWVTLIGLPGQVSQMEEMAAQHRAIRSDEMARRGQLGAQAAKASGAYVSLAAQERWQQAEPVLREAPMSVSALAAKLGCSYDGVGKHLPAWLSMGWVIIQGKGNLRRLGLPGQEETLEQAVREACLKRTKHLSKARATQAGKPASKPASKPDITPSASEAKERTKAPKLQSEAQPAPPTAREPAQEAPRPVPVPSASNDPTVEVMRWMQGQPWQDTYGLADVSRGVGMNIKQTTRALGELRNQDKLVCSGGRWRRKPNQQEVERAILEWAARKILHAKTLTESLKLGSEVGWGFNAVVRVARLLVERGLLKETDKSGPGKRQWKATDRGRREVQGMAA